MIKRVIISGGGTGGHIFPAISIADAIKRRNLEAQILFVGAKGRMEMERVPNAGYPIKGLEIMGLNRKNIFKNVTVIRKYLAALVEARDIIREFKPEVVIGVGGYASAPTLKAAQSLHVPTLIQEQNSYAGVTNKMLAKRANTICVSYPEMERFFPKDRIVLVGNPIRPAIEFLQPDRAAALEYFGFKLDTKKVVLIVGGSLGALTINESIGSHLEEWERSGVSMIWQTGKAFYERAKTLLAQYPDLDCSLNAFVDRMDYAYTLADLVISRAGACSISELCLLGKPSILVPSPNVAEDHQTKNAKALSSRNAAVLVLDAEARRDLTAQAIALIRDDNRLETLRREVLLLAYPQAAEKIVDEAEKLVGAKTK